MSEPSLPPPRDVDLLRRLAERKARIAADPANLERRELWYRHDAGMGGRPMVLAEVQGVRDPEHPLPDQVLECRDAEARSLEMSLRREIYQFDVLRDDHVVEPRIGTNWQVQSSGYGIETVHQYPEFDGPLGARRWDAPIQDLDRDFDQLQARSHQVDRAATLAQKGRLERIFGDVLPVQIRGGFWWTMGMTWPAIELVGLENLMVFMFDNPPGLHRLMAFLRDDHLAHAAWLAAEGLLSLNNENDYIGSGSMGYTRGLPRDDEDAGMGTQTRDQWVLLESQETVGVGPEQFEEFIFPYQRRVAEEFGRCYYGCCEPVHQRLQILKQLPNLKRVSVSPWADEELTARELGGDYVYSRKPHPGLISTSTFDEDAIRADLRQTLTAARNCRVELIMKDVHTLHNEPHRLPRWVELARETIDEMGF